MVANALSRVIPQGQCLIISLPNLECLHDIKLSVRHSSVFHELPDKIRQQSESHPDFSVHHDLIFYRDKIWLPSDNPFIPLLMTEFHSTPLEGHMGIAKTLRRLQANFFWEGMHRDVHCHVSQCRTRQQTKYETRKPAGLLQSLPMLTSLWEDLSLDFIIGLPPSQGFTTIPVVIDRYSKGTHLSALPPKYSTKKVTSLFIKIFCKLHGFPHSLVLNRDPIFVSSFWQELFRLSDTKLCFSTSYHLEIDGQAEVLNRTLEQYLNLFVHDCPLLWYSFLSLAEWSYNTSIHSSTGLPPYEITYDKPPPSIPHYLLGSSPVEAADSILNTRQTLHNQLQHHLMKAQTAMK